MTLKSQTPLFHNSDNIAEYSGRLELKTENADERRLSSRVPAQAPLPTRGVLSLSLEIEIGKISPVKWQ